MTDDGDLALLDVSGPEEFKIWSAGIASGVSTVLERNGNLVVYNAVGDVVWESDSRSESGARLTFVADEANIRSSHVQIIDENYLPIWQSLGYGNTHGGGPCKFQYIFSGDPVVFGIRSYLCDSTPGLIFGMDETGDLALLDVSGDTPSKLWSAGTEGAGTRAEILEDGNFVVFGANSQILWESKTDGSGTEVSIGIDEESAAVPFAYLIDSNYNTVWWTLRPGGTSGGGPCVAGSLGIGAGSVLQVDEYVCETKNLIFGMTEDGDLSLLDVLGADPLKVWSAGTGGNQEAYMYLGTDGNLAVYQSVADDAAVLWQSNTAGSGANALFVHASDILRDSYFELAEEIGPFSSISRWRSDGGDLGILGRADGGGGGNGGGGTDSGSFGVRFTSIVLTSAVVVICCLV